MLNILLILSQFAFAQIHCKPTTGNSGVKNEIFCGDNLSSAFTKNDQKVKTLVLHFENNKRGFERSIEIINPNLSVSQINEMDFSKSSVVKKEIEKIKKEWNMPELKPQISSFTLENKTPLFANAQLKEKVDSTKISTKIQRSVASEAPIAGGIRSASDEKAK